MLGVVIIIILIGVALYLVNAYVPMAAPIKTILNVVVIVALVLWLLNIFGLFDSNVFNYHYQRSYHR
jgi:hypothetical protein